VRVTPTPRLAPSGAYRESMGEKSGTATLCRETDGASYTLAKRPPIRLCSLLVGMVVPFGRDGCGCTK